MKIIRNRVDLLVPKCISTEIVSKLYMQDRRTSFYKTQNFFIRFNIHLAKARLSMTLPFDTFVLSSIKKFGIDDDDEIVRKSYRDKKFLSTSKLVAI